jgi:hypothetical protein
MVRLHGDNWISPLTPATRSGQQVTDQTAARKGTAADKLS